MSTLYWYLLLQSLTILHVVMRGFGRILQKLFFIITFSATYNLHVLSYLYRIYDGLI